MGGSSLFEPSAGLLLAAEDKEVTDFVDSCFLGGGVVLIELFFFARYRVRDGFGVSEECVILIFSKAVTS